MKRVAAYMLGPRLTSPTTESVPSLVPRLCLVSYRDLKHQVDWSGYETYGPIIIWQVLKLRSI